MLKFHKVDESVLLARVTIKDTTHLLYYFPRASRLCIQKDQTSTAVYIVNYAKFLSFELSDTELKI